MGIKHASEESLTAIADLLCAIRKASGLRRGKAYLHFHESSDGELFADVRLFSDPEFERHNVSTKTSQEDFLGLIEKDLGAGEDMPVAATT